MVTLDKRWQSIDFVACVAHRLSSDKNKNKTPKRTDEVLRFGVMILCTKPKPIMIVTNFKTNNEILADSIGKLIDLDAITERLLATDCQQCSMFTHEQVKLAFLKWIEQHIDSIEEQPDWFINNEPKHFYRHLPFDELQEATDLREYDYREMYEAMAIEGNPDNESFLENDFDGTPEEAALAAINW